MWGDRANVEDMLGETLTQIEGAFVGNDSIRFYAESGKAWQMLHWQDCCESVEIDDIIGDINDLIGEPLLMSEEVTNSDDDRREKWDESWTWTFYKFATKRGYVTLKWYGTSNGYYSESVSFEEMP